ncbi:hypothetical protein AB9P05_19080 [Roseivirga sp. BDSF3-8]|uniref:hypothetical protein n=1 Tax=Roseivirga sp. BDSF3-8 TaxID=3241598 RepID=UPI003531CA51
MKTINLMAWIMGMLLLLPVTAHSQFQDLEFLRIDKINYSNEWFKLGNNPDSFEGPGVDVTAGGNTHMRMTFRVSEASSDNFFIYLRLNGEEDSRVFLKDYLPEGFEVSYEWTTVDIPLGDFYSLELYDLYQVEIEFSARQVFDLKHLEFTGGSSPYLWFGFGKRDNSNNGDGFNGNFIADVQSDLYISADLEYSKALSPYNGKATLIAIYKDQFDQEAYDALWEWSDGYIGRKRDGLAPGDYEVVFGPIDGAYDTLTFSLESQGPLSPEVSFQSPSGSNDGNLSISLSEGLPSYFHENSLIKFNDANTEVLTSGFYGYTQGYNAPLDVSEDHEGNFYEITTYQNSFWKYLIKRNADYDLIWAQDADYIY